MEKWHKRFLQPFLLSPSILSSVQLQSDFNLSHSSEMSLSRTSMLFMSHPIPMLLGVPAACGSVNRCLIETCSSLGFQARITTTPHLSDCSSSNAARVLAINEGCQGLPSAFSFPFMLSPQIISSNPKALDIPLGDDFQVTVFQPLLSLAPQTLSTPFYLDIQKATQIQHQEFQNRTLDFPINFLLPGLPHSGNDITIYPVIWVENPNDSVFFSLFVHPVHQQSCRSYHYDSS